MPLILSAYLAICCPPPFIPYESNPPPWEGPKEIKRYMKTDGVLEQKDTALKFYIIQKVY